MALGDVIAIHGGKTVEVIDTDAEGRLIMSDALALAVEEPTDAVIDIATLTGSCARALGDQIAGVLGNDQALIDQIRMASESTSELVWQLPLHRPYRKILDSDVADLQNCGPVGKPDAILAALELAGHRKGGAFEFIDPNDHVNRGQSTNDSYPTALKIGLCRSIERLLAELRLLEGALREKGREFEDLVKVGRTQLQDAVPMTLQQEFESFAVTLGEDHQHFEDLRHKLWEISLGGTAIGTGIAADPAFAAAAAKHLARSTGYRIVVAPNLIEATTDVGVFVELSGALKRTAIKLSKICNDLRLLSSGPQAGFNEIHLPPRQAGSSIMPGKVNPVIPECVNSVAFAVVGHDATLTMAAEAGQLQLNAFGPVIAYALFETLAWMTNAMATLRVNCVAGITANRAHLAQQLDSFVGVITALIPRIGYGPASALAKEALATRVNIGDLVVRSGLLSPDEAGALLSPRRLTSNQAPPPGASRE